MGLITTYSLYTSVYLLVGYLVYKWLMAGEKQLRLNRATLMLIYAIAFCAMPVSELFGEMMAHGSATGGLGVDTMSGELISTRIIRQSVWLEIVVGTYFVGLLVSAILTIMSAWRIKRVINTGRQVSAKDGVKLVLLDDSKAAPFSWMNYVVISADDYASGGSVILAHELAHIRHYHCIDLIIAQIVCIFQWFNPAAWLMREELKAVHEFQADNTVLSSGIAPREYQMLLIKKAVGIRFQSLANSLNHSNLKKRITMMYNQKSSAGRKLRALALVPALGAALAVCNIPAVASTLSATSSVTISTESKTAFAGGKVTENLSDGQDRSLAKSEVPPQYPGGELAMYSYLMKNVRYPEEAKKQNIDGVVAVKFTIAADGSVTDVEVVKSVNPLLDAEAVRVIRTMPKWTPGTIDGKPVAVSMTVPISFKCEPGITAFITHGSFI